MGGAPEGAIQTKSSDRRKASVEESVLTKFELRVIAILVVTNSPLTLFAKKC